MYYCSSCGESGDGRFCRMCGTALSPVTDPTQAQTQVQPQQYQAQQHYSAAAATQLLGPGPGAPGPEYAGPGPEYDSLFRSDDGSFRSTDRTQLLPPTPVSVDYRMAPPGTSVLPSYDTDVPRQGPQDPGGHDGGGYQDGWPPQDDEDSEAPRKGVIYGTLGAVGVAIAVIAALLYFGTPGPAPASTGANAQVSAPAGQSGSVAPGQLQLPSGQPVPTTTPPPVQTTPPPAATTAPPAQHGGSTLPLSTGSTGSLVRYVQERLHQLGFYNGPASSQFDQPTAIGVERFQASSGERGDPAGVVGRSTMTALVAAGSQPALRPGGGDSADVKRLQESLNYAENAGLQVNGKFDANTWTAVLRYQSGVGLAPSGSVTPATWSKLQSGTLVG